MRLYQKECAKLRKISENAIGILAANGLDSQMKSSKVMRNFMKTINWNQVFIDQMANHFSSEENQEDVLKQVKSNLENM